MAILFSTSINTFPAVSSSSQRRNSDIPLNVSTPSIILHSPSLSSYLSSSSASSIKNNSSKALIKSLRAAATQQKYVYPDPIPEFAEAETQKFKGELLKKLLKNKETFGDDLDTVVRVCAEILCDFLHKEYGGPGTLLVEPFTDMLVALKEKKLPGAPVAARAALLWAQNYLDQDWEIWTSKPPKPN